MRIVERHCHDLQGVRTVNPFNIVGRERDVPPV
jgi:hypothetical protein